MRNIYIIAARELRSYVGAPIAYIVTSIFLALSGTFFATYLAGTNYSDTSLTGFLEVAGFLIVLFAVVLTMRLVAEEKKLGTFELLLTAPVRDAEIVLGKFAGSTAILLAMLALTLYFPLLLIAFGDPDLGPIFTSYAGLSLIGGASLAIGLFASSISSNQIIAAVVAAGILFGFWFFGTAARLTPGVIGQTLSYLSLFDHIPDFVRGIIDTRAIVYYFSVTALFLFLSVRSIETSRWS